MAEQVLEPPAPWPNRDGYVHADALLRQAVEAQLDRAGPIVPLSPEDLKEFCSRDVGANADEPIAEVYTEPMDRTVTLLLDERTAAVVMFAARLLAANYEAHAREVRVVADQLPDGSYGSKNRIDIAARHERIAGRVRVLERSYQQAVDTEYFGI